MKSVRQRLRLACRDERGPGGIAEGAGEAWRCDTNEATDDASIAVDMIDEERGDLRYDRRLSPGGDAGPRIGERKKDDARAVISKLTGDLLRRLVPVGRRIQIDESLDAVRRGALHVARMKVH